MTHKEADGGKVNPNYNKNIENEWSRNCQTCVVAYEARRRGFNCEATPNYNQNGNNAYKSVNNNKLSHNTAKGFCNKDGSNIIPVTYKNIKNDDIPHAMDSIVKEGERHFVSVAWITGGKHVFSMEKKNGKLFWYDPQTNIEYMDEASMKKKLLFVTDGSVTTYRIDNADISALGKSVLVPSGSQKP